MTGFSCAFTVDGIPIPQGSMRAFMAGSRPVVTYDRGGSLGAWRESVAARAGLAMLGQEPFRGPVVISLTFRFPRPDNHFRKDGTVRPSAPTLPAIRPDLDKLVRAALDAMTGIVFADDKLVVDMSASKHYARAGEHPGLVVSIWSAG